MFSPDFRVLILIDDIEYSFNLWPVIPSIELALVKLNRRHYLRLIARLSPFLITPALWAKSLDVPDGVNMDRAPDFKAILNHLVGNSPRTEDHGLSLEAPQVAENGALVPVSLNSRDSSDELFLLAEGNPGPLLAEFHFYGSALPKVSLRVKLNQTGPVTALSRSQNGWMRVDQLVKVTKGGCE